MTTYVIKRERAELKNILLLAEPAHLRFITTGTIFILYVLNDINKQILLSFVAPR